MVKKRIQKYVKHGRRSLATRKKHLARTGGHIHPKAVSDPIIRKQWDKDVSVRQNFERIGLKVAINEDIKPIAKSGLVEAVPINSQVLKALEEKASLGEKRRPKHIPEGEQIALDAMIEKYGDDYVKMARDIKLNCLQHTPAKLKKKCEAYLAEVEAYAAFVEREASMTKEEDKKDVTKEHNAEDEKEKGLEKKKTSSKSGQGKHKDKKSEKGKL